MSQYYHYVIAMTPSPTCDEGHDALVRGVVDMAVSWWAQEIAKKLGVSASTVSKFAYRYGIDWPYVPTFLSYNLSNRRDLHLDKCLFSDYLGAFMAYRPLPKNMVAIAVKGTVEGLAG
jgi:hypothetical protein